MNPDENNEFVEDELSLSELLVPDTPEVKLIKSIYENEYEYSEYLGEIEYSIAEYYYKENRKVTDKDVIKALKNIKQNRDKPISFFKKALEKEIVKSLVEPLEESPLTDHEFILVLDYVLWVIDNRSWLEDKQAYVKWITYVLGFFSEGEEKKYESQFKKLACKLGVSAAQVDMLLMKREMADDFFEEEDLFEGGGLFEGLSPDEILGVDRAAEDLETGFFLMTDDEKFDFLLDKGPDYVELVQDYVSELESKGDFEKIQAFYKKFNEKHENFFPLHFIVGTTYLNSDPALAISYFEKTLKATENLEEFPPEMREELKRHMDLLARLLIEEATEKVEEKATESKKGKKTCKSGKKASKKDPGSKKDA
jgi:tetratricopeptide (TPR) repeat protein